MLKATLKFGCILLEELHSSSRNEDSTKNCKIKLWIVKVGLMNYSNPKWVDLYHQHTFLSAIPTFLNMIT